METQTPPFSKTNGILRIGVLSLLIVLLAAITVFLIHLLTLDAPAKLFFVAIFGLIILCILQWYENRFLHIRMKEFQVLKISYLDKSYSTPKIVTTYKVEQKSFNFRKYDYEWIFMKSYYEEKDAVEFVDAQFLSDEKVEPIVVYKKP